MINHKSPNIQYEYRNISQCNRLIAKSRTMIINLQEHIKLLEQDIKAYELAKRMSIEKIEELKSELLSTIEN